jgi:hypothetical protein
LVSVLRESCFCEKPAKIAFSPAAFSAAQPPRAAASRRRLNRNFQRERKFAARPPTLGPFGIGGVVPLRLELKAHYRHRRFRLMNARQRSEY